MSTAWPPPATTDFAILFLPTEGLYAEVLRRPGLTDLLQRNHRVVGALCCFQLLSRLLGKRLSQRFEGLFQSIDLRPQRLSRHFLC